MKIRIGECRSRLPNEMHRCVKRNVYTYLKIINFEIMVKSVRLESFIQSTIIY